MKKYTIDELKNIWEQAAAAAVAAVAGVEIDEAMDEIMVAEVQEAEAEAEAAAEQEARRAELADVPEWVNDPDQWDGRYDYREAVTACVLSAIVDNAYITESGRARDYGTREDLEERLNDGLWTDDAVTGNGSGSFFCNAWKAETALRGNWGMLADVLRELGRDGVDVLEEGAEAMDVTIRCYLLPECIAAALDRLEEENLISYGD